MKIGTMYGNAEEEKIIRAEAKERGMSVSNLLRERSKFPVLKRGAEFGNKRAVGKERAKKTRSRRESSG